MNNQLTVTQRAEIKQGLQQKLIAFESYHPQINQEQTAYWLHFIFIHIRQLFENRIQKGKLTQCKFELFIPAPIFTTTLWPAIEYYNMGIHSQYHKKRNDTHISLTIFLYITSLQQFNSIFQNQIPFQYLCDELLDFSSI